MNETKFRKLLQSHLETFDADAESGWSISSPILRHGKIVVKVTEEDPETLEARGEHVFEIEVRKVG